MTVHIDLPASDSISYDIVIDELPELSYDRSVAVITNPTVSGLHKDRLLDKLNAASVEWIEVPDGEEYKNIDTIMGILERLFEARFDRKSLLIAFGGGVIGDMTGFTASLYQRGIDFVQIPTTLLSQVDASVGGKTGVNTKWGKNLIGAFYQPKAVYIDPWVLSTLPDREFAAGLAEVIKMAVMFDSDFFGYLGVHDLHQDDVIREMIRRSVSLKANVVIQDEKESGLRAALNYGHTFGHVIEKETRYKRYLHGEAVAMGMVMANRLAVDMGYLSANEADAIEALLSACDLPTRYEIEDIDAFYESFFLDKKSQNGEITFVLPNGSIGTHQFVKNIDPKVVKSALEVFAKGI